MTTATETTIVQAIAPHLGEGWTGVTRPMFSDERQEHILIGPGGAAVELNLSEGRLVFSGLFPGRYHRSHGDDQAAGRTSFHGLDLHRITLKAATATAPAKCAAELKRRLLPGYLPQVVEWLRRVDAARAGLSQQRLTAEALSVVLGVKVWWGLGSQHGPDNPSDAVEVKVRPSGKMEPFYGEFKVSGSGSCELKLSSITPAAALRIARALAMMAAIPDPAPEAGPDAR